jgi:hypothetical protein
LCTYIGMHVQRSDLNILFFYIVIDNYVLYLYYDFYDYICNINKNKPKT